MHPSISKLPSLLFYGGKLLDGPNMEAKTSQPWHQKPELGVYKFFNVSGVEQQTDRGHSQYNLNEVKVAIALYDKLLLDFDDINFDFRVGIITMYRGQVQKLKEEFSKKYGRGILTRIDFNTVDGFQGQEKDIIILSCVRAGPNLTSIGFLTDLRRVNVALTRSRSSLYILGNAGTLARSDEFWSKLVEDAKDRKLFITV